MNSILEHVRSFLSLGHVFEGELIAQSSKIAVEYALAYQQQSGLISTQPKRLVAQLSTHGCGVDTKRSYETHDGRGDGAGSKHFRDGNGYGCGDLHDEAPWIKVRNRDGNGLGVGMRDSVFAGFFCDGNGFGSGSLKSSTKGNGMGFGVDEFRSPYPFQTSSEGGE